MSIDDISPEYVGERRIDLSLAELNPKPGDVVVVRVSYARTLPEGVVPPLEAVVIRSTDGVVVMRRAYSLPPEFFDFVPEEAGAYMARLGEAFHNRWAGVLEFEVR